LVAEQSHTAPRLPLRPVNLILWLRIWLSMRENPRPFGRWHECRMSHVVPNRRAATASVDGALITGRRPTEGRSTDPNPPGQSEPLEEVLLGHELDQLALHAQVPGLLCFALSVAPGHSTRASWKSMTRMLVRLVSPGAGVAPVVRHRTRRCGR